MWAVKLFKTPDVGEEQKQTTQSGSKQGIKESHATKITLCGSIDSPGNLLLSLQK